MCDLPRELNEPEPIEIGHIPDLSKVHLYRAVFEATRDDPRLLVLWCCYALWREADRAVRITPTAEAWAERAGLDAQVVRSLTSVLVARGLITTPQLIPFWDLQAASFRASAIITDDLRRRAGLPPIQHGLSLE